MFRLRAPYSIQQVHVGADVLVDERSSHGLFALHAIFLIAGLGALGWYFGPQLVGSVAAPAARTIGAIGGVAAGTALATVA